ncbi:MAG: hypothetical protein V3V20_08150 [Algisphaera sp.]
MSDQKRRMAIAAQAAALMYSRQESEYFTAKRKAARAFGVNPRSHPKDLPSNKEVQDRLRAYAQLMEGPARTEVLRDMRLEALVWMHRLMRFKPHLIGSVLTGHVRKGSDIDLHVFANSIESITLLLDEEQATYTVERKQVIKHHQTRIYRHVHLEGAGGWPIELTVYRADECNYSFQSSITGKTIERADVSDVIALVEREHPDASPTHNAQEAADETATQVDVAFMYRLLLEPLAGVAQSKTHHPEGNALYHSLQVFCHAIHAAPYDHELVAAALLHDVGKAIDPADHVNAGLEALDGIISNRTHWLIAHHMDAHKLKAGTLGHRATQRLRQHENFDDLMQLQTHDQAGRQRGVAVPTIEEALNALMAMG